MTCVWAWAVAAMMGAPGAEETRMEPVPVEMYTQSVTLTFASPAEAAAAQLSFAPVYDDKEWAFSGRWDDNQPNSLNMHKALSKHGLKSNYYLTATDKDSKYGAAFAQQLEQNGHAIGGHSMSHPKFAELPPNRVFWEVLANRVEREAQIDTPLNSFAFPYGQFEDKANPRVKETTSLTLARSGYSHCVYINFVNNNPYLPQGDFSTVLQVVPGDREVDEAKFRAAVDKILQSPAAYRKSSTCISLGVHAWQQGEAWDQLDVLFAELAANDWWFCSLTDYAAYERQLRRSTIEPAGVAQGNRRTFALTRPTPAACGADWPLTVKVAGGTVTAAKVDGHDVAVMAGKVNVPNGVGQTTPVRIGRVENTTGAATLTDQHQDPDFPGLKALLTLDPAGQQLVLKLANESGQPLSQGRVTFRLPLQYANGVIAQTFGDVAANATTDVALPLPATRDDPAWAEGTDYYVAEMDFRLGDEVGRLFATIKID